MGRENEELLDLMLQYPFILPDTSNLYKGYLAVDGKDYFIQFEECISGIKLIVTKDLQQFEPDISNLLTETNKVKFLDNLKAFISSKQLSKTLTSNSEIYWHILTEYVELREFYINIHSSSIASDLSSVKISCRDDSGRLHEISVSTNCEDVRYVFDVVQHSLPEQIGLFDRCSSLKVIYEKFQGLVNKLQHFYNVMDSLDQNCWILDPVKPTKKDCYRRIALDTNVSLIVNINPWIDHSVPDIKLLGPDRLIDGRKQKLTENLINWDTNTDFIQEFLKLLDMDTFIAPPKDFNTEILLCNMGECCICFSMRLDDKLPEILCQNQSCEQLFHKECLYQWLTSVNARRSFNKLYGDCPNCEKIISCPV